MKTMTFLILAALLAGCATVRYSDVGGRKMVDVENTRWSAYLVFFPIFPIASGEPDAPNEEMCRIFQDSMTLENNMKLLDYALEKSGAQGVRNLTTRFSDTTYCFFLKRYSCQTSAELVAPKFFPGNQPMTDLP